MQVEVDSARAAVKLRAKNLPRPPQIDTANCQQTAKDRTPGGHDLPRRTAQQVDVQLVDRRQDFFLWLARTQDTAGVLVYIYLPTFLALQHVEAVCEIRAG